LVDFNLFNSALDIIYYNDKLTYDNIIQILSFKGSMGRNTGLPAGLKKLFPEVTKISRPVISSNSINSPLWLAGFVSGDGMFYVKTKPVYYKGSLRRFALVFS